MENEKILVLLKNFPNVIGRHLIKDCIKASNKSLVNKSVIHIFIINTENLFLLRKFWFIQFRICSKQS